MRGLCHNLDYLSLFHTVLLTLLHLFERLVPSFEQCSPFTQLFHFLSSQEGQITSLLYQTNLCGKERGKLQPMAPVESPSSRATHHSSRVHLCTLFIRTHIDPPITSGHNPCFFFITKHTNAHFTLAEGVANHPLRDVSPSLSLSRSGCLTSRLLSPWRSPCCYHLARAKFQPETARDSLLLQRVCDCAGALGRCHYA